MAGKGGKDTPASRGKSAMKTPSSKSGSLKGKDWTAKNDAKILFESPENSDSDEGFLKEKNELPPKSGGKGSTETLKSGKNSSFDSLKTGGKSKDGKMGKSSGKGKVPTGLPKVVVEVDAKLEIDLPKNAEIIMDCEAASILQGIQDYLPSLTRDPLVKVPVSFNKALEHANNGDLYTSPESVREILQKLKSKGITDGEICMISRVCPETTDEVFALVPSLKANKQKNEGAIKEALVELAKLKKSM